MLRNLLTKANLVKGGVVMATTIVSVILMGFFAPDEETLEETTEVYEETKTVDVPVEETVVTEVKKTRTRATS